MLLAIVKWLLKLWYYDLLFTNFIYTESILNQKVFRFI